MEAMTAKRTLYEMESASMAAVAAAERKRDSIQQLIAEELRSGDIDIELLADLRVAEAWAFRNIAYTQAMLREVHAKQGQLHAKQVMESLLTVATSRAIGFTVLERNGWQQ